MLKASNQRRDHLEAGEPPLTQTERDNLKIQTKKLYSKAAIVELMCAESMCIRPQINEKLQALVRMTQLCRGQAVAAMPFGKQIFKADDEYTVIVKILPYMLKFTIQCLENSSAYNKEIVIIAALRNLQFILEAQGCSLDSAMIVILKSIFKNYPDKARQDRIQKRERERVQKITMENELVAKTQDQMGTNSLKELASPSNQIEIRNIIRF